MLQLNWHDSRSVTVQSNTQKFSSLSEIIGHKPITKPHTHTQERTPKESINRKKKKRAGLTEIKLHSNEQ